MQFDIVIDSGVWWDDISTFGTKSQLAREIETVDAASVHHSHTHLQTFEHSASFISPTGQTAIRALSSPQGL